MPNHPSIVFLRKERKMPKMKTHSSAKKRFRLTASGKVRYNSAYRRHRLLTKNKQARERNQGTKVMCDADATKIKRYFLVNG
jgi:large subunit ribosomal protein L35